MKSPAFQFYAQDFLTGVMYLTNEEIGIYIKMLAKQWTDEKIPKKRLGLLVGYDWENLSDEVKNKFEDRGDYIVNIRLELERDKKIKFLEKQSINGKKGGRPRKTTNIKNPNESQKKPLEDEDEDIIIKGQYKKKDFLIDWNELRVEHLHKPSFLNSMQRDTEDIFNELLKNYSREDFRFALIGLFKQKELPNGNSSMQSNPRHFLNYFESYITAYHDKNKSLYGKKEKGVYEV